MDWINQGKYVKWLIAVLLVVNISTITIIWILIGGRRGPAPFEGGNNPQGTLEMIRHEVNLSGDQVKKFEDLRNENFKQVKILFDKIDSSKALLAKELAKEKIDTVLVNSITKKIGLTLAETEKSRLGHFRDLMAICTPEQKVKLLPILEKLIGGKPPQDKPGEGPMRGGEENGHMRPPRPEEGPKPGDGRGY